MEKKVREKKSQEKKSPLKVAIVGFTTHREKAPFKDESFQIWAMNDLYRFVPRVDVLFELHTRKLLNSKNRETQAHEEWLKSSPIPVFMQEHYDDIPKSVRYPIETIVEKYGNYFTNSVSYMIALAIEEGASEIHLYGVDMAGGGEYEEQRPSVEYFLGIAKGKGIKVHVPPESELLKTMYLYGYEDEKETAMQLTMKERKKMLTGQLNHFQNSLESNLIEKARREGAIQELMYVERRFRNIKEMKNVSE